MDDERESGPAAEETDEVPAGETQAAADDAASPAPPDPIRRVTLIVLGVCLVVFIWYVASDRVTPFTDQARVKSLIFPVVPQVSGYLTESNVRLHDIVAADDVLFQIDRRQFEMAVRSAEAKLDDATQSVGARGAGVKSAAGQLGVAKAQLDRARRSDARTEAILQKNPGALSQADRDRTETSLAQALEKVTAAEAELERAKEELGVEGPGNPQIRVAVAALENAQLDLARTTMQAPFAGAIESLDLDVGHYAAAGQPLATFMSAHDIWIQADMRENNLTHIKIGDRAEFFLDSAPGRVFQGTVRSIGFGVSDGSGSNRGQLPTIKAAQGWLRDPQRFPVIIDIGQVTEKGLFRTGGQVDVIVYTGNSRLLDGIGRIYLRLRSLLSYVR